MDIFPREKFEDVVGQERPPELMEFPQAVSVDRLLVGDGNRILTIPLGK